MRQVIINKLVEPVLVLLMLLYSYSAHGQKAGISLDNQLSSWLNINLADTVRWQTGIRYIPVVSPFWQINDRNKIDAELSVKTYGDLSFYDFSFDSADFSFKPYRLWLRYTSSNLEIRAGLQKINFGSSLIFRPLMWFDKMDFRDPLQLTDGVYALLGRYYFNNNINIWLWGLYGNDKPKGWEISPSADSIPEYGGRFQFPLFKGELAMSYHHRNADYSDLLAGMPMINRTHFTEQSFAIDGKWDLGVGLWFEYVLKMNEDENPVTSRLESYLSIGADYTIDLGKGLNVTTEYFHYGNKPEGSEPKRQRNLLTLSLNYPVSVSHNLSGVVYYNWNDKEWFRFVNLKLSYDYLSLFIMAYWNPEKLMLFNNPNESALFAGKGFQVMLVLDI